MSNADCLAYLEQELDSVKHLLDSAEDCRYFYQALLEYSASYLELEAGRKEVTTREMAGWLAELRKIDPLREGRWRDLDAEMELQVILAP